MAVRIAPVGRQQFFDNQGRVANGMKLFTYLATTTTKQPTFTSSTGGVQNANPILLDSAGRTPSGLWLTDGVLYKFALAPANDTDPPASPVWTEDNISSGDATLAALAASSGASLIGANDGSSGSIFTTVQGFITKILSSIGSSLVGFIQSGVGASATTAQTELRRHVWAEQFGFSTAGTAAANTTALQAAIDSLTNGGVVNIGPGAFVFNKITIPLKIPIILRGRGIPNQATGAATGTELRSTLRDGTSAAINCVVAAEDYALFSMEDLYLSGGTYAEVVVAVGAGGAPLGNFVGLSIKNRLRWHLRNVRIAGFDTDNFRIDTLSYYGAAYNCSFMFGGTGVNSIDGGDVEGFYNCHFQYNIYGTVNVKNTFGCSWEGQWKSGARYTIASDEIRHYTPYFEGNNSSNTADEADIRATVAVASIMLESPYFASGAGYSSKVVATHLFHGECGRLHLSGAMRVIHASPQVYALFKMLGTSAIFDSTGHPRDIANWYSFASNTKSYHDLCDLLKRETISGATLSHRGYKKIMPSAASGQTITTIDFGYEGMVISLLFTDANITLNEAGNIALSGAFTSTGNDVMQLMFLSDTGTWCEVSRSVN